MIGRVIEIPAKRHERALICYLNLDEINALLAAPDRTSWLGRRDHAMLLTAIQTGLRVSELVALRVGDVSSAPALTSGSSAKACLHTAPLGVDWWGCRFVRRQPTCLRSRGSCSSGGS